MKTLDEVFEKAVELENETAINYDKHSNSNKYYIKNGVIFNECDCVLFDPDNEGASINVLVEYAKED